MLYSQFKTNPDRERQGIFIEYGFLKHADGSPDETRPVRFKVARAGGANSTFLKRLESRMKPYRRQVQTDSMDNGIAQKIMRDIFAETVVMGWENVQTEAGDDLPFTVENCVKLFSDLPELFNDLMAQASNGALFRAELRASDAGN